jgi:hypothetical protein
MRVFNFYRFQIILAVFITLIFSVDRVSSQNLHLNEIMSSNNNTISDEDGDFEDWIEIYNSGQEAVNLADYGLSDDYDNPFRWTFPDTTLEAGGFMLVWASNKDRAEPGGELHTNYAISSAGEEVILTRPDGTRADELSPTEIPSDFSVGRQPDGTGNWVYFDQPTPGESNTTQSISDLLDEPSVSHQPGFYTSAFELELSHPEEGVTLYYTLDGSTPTLESAEYSGPITITNRTSEPNYFSVIPTNNLGGRHGFTEPTVQVPKGNVVRVLAVKDGFYPSLKSYSYFVYSEGRNFHTLPVISITTDSLSLFGHEEGIYVPGTLHTEGNHDTGNYFQRGREWEREAGFDFFDENGELQFSQNVGLRIHGGFTRRFAQKSLRIYARSDYGESRINYPIFPDQDYNSYNRLLLRNSGNDQGYTMFRDAAAHLMVRHFNMDTQAYRPAAVYINGEYWGLHNIRERYDRHYLERVYGINPDNIDYLNNHWVAGEGTNDDYVSLINYINNRDLSDDENMAYVHTRIDIDNLLDYYTAKIYFANTDWPHNNIDFWRSRVPYTEGAPPGHDGRYRWMFYDLDFTMGLVSPASRDMIAWLTRRFDHGDREWPNMLIRNLLENETFKHDLINRIADHLNTSFRPGRLLGIIEDVQQRIEPEMHHFVQRWQYPLSMNAWRNYIIPLRSYVNDRPGYLRQHIINHFSTESTAEITVNVSDASRGSVFVNSLKISPDTPGISGDPFPWNGIYFTGIPVLLRANPEPGFQFSHWLADGSPVYDKELSILPGTVDEVTAVFDEIKLSQIEPFRLADGAYLFSEWNEDEPAATAPGSMAFVYMDEADPGPDSNVSGVTLGAFNLSSRTRINGLGEDGFAFINTTNPEGNPGYPGTRLGGAVLVLDTRDIYGAEVGFKAGTVLPNSLIYNLRLQYRIGDEGNFLDLPGPDGEPVEYQRNEEEGHLEFIGPVALPEQVIGEPRVELLWRYYYTGEQADEAGGQRSKLNISSIHVAAVPEEPLPLPHPMVNGTYEFSYWPADTTAGAAPPSMAFAYMSHTDPSLNASILGYTRGVFHYESRSRVNGLHENGVGFINTSNLEGNPGYPGRRLGGAVLALNTERHGSITVEWTGGTLEPNSRIYNLRLQYRTSPDEPFRDIPDQHGNPVEYQRNETAGHSRKIGPVILPGDAEDQPYVQLFWRYYYTGVREDEESGQRSKLNITNIRVSSFPLMGGEPGEPEVFQLYQNYPNPFYPHTTIRYDLPAAQHVRLDLYTITGQHVKRIEDRQARAGRHSVDLDVSSLASGIYIYRIVTDDFSDAGRMSVIR